MKTRNLLSIFFVLFVFSTSFAQVDTDGDLNADVTDPWPNDASQGGVYAGCTITYNVLMAGDLDATEFTGTVIFIQQNDITFNGNGYKIIAPNAENGIYVYSSNNIHLTNVVLAEQHGKSILLVNVNNSYISNISAYTSSPVFTENFGIGIVLNMCNNNVVESCNFSRHVTGIYVEGTSSYNLIQNNNCSKSGGWGTGTAIGQYIGDGTGNRYLNNDCSGSAHGGGVLMLHDPAEVSGNDLTNSVWGGAGVVLTNYSSLWPLPLQDVIDNNTFSGTANVLCLSGVVEGSNISDLDFTGKNNTGATLVISSGQNLTISNIDMSDNASGLLLSDVHHSMVSQIIAPTTSPIFSGNFGNGIDLWSCNNNTVEDCNLAGRVCGVELYYTCNNNLIQRNDCRRCGGWGTGAAIEQRIDGAGNRYLNNNCSGSAHGGGVLRLHDPAEVSGNDLTNSPWTDGAGVQLCNYSSSWQINLQTVINENNFSGTTDGLSLWDVVNGSCISNLKLLSMNVTRNGLVIANGENLTISSIEFDNTSRGLALYSIKNSTISNILYSNPVPGVYQGAGITLSSCNNNIIQNSSIEGGWSGFLVCYSSCNNVFRNNKMQYCYYGICDQVTYVDEGDQSKVYHNNIYNNVQNAYFVQPIELSYNGEGNYWGHSCEDPYLFEPGVDSNSPDVVDSNPYGIIDGWLNPQVTPGCPIIKNLPPVADAGGPYNVTEGGSVQVFATGTDPDEDPIIFAWDLDNDNVFETPGRQAFFSAADIDGPGSAVIRVRVTDSGGLSDTNETVVEIENISPSVGPITATVDPVQVNTQIQASASFTDPGTSDTHTALWEWGDGYSSDGTVEETGGNGTVSGSHAYSVAGVYTLKLIVKDKDEGVGTASYQFVVVFNPDAGFVTGGGWINSPEGAYPADPNLTGKANFGFVSKYQKGANVPTGQTEFQFRVADLNFRSNVYQWLVVAGNKAQFKGSGTINNDGDYGFILTATDGQLKKVIEPDKFRIKIWNKNQEETIIYDNQLAAGDDTEPTTEIGGGNIVIHKEGLKKSTDQALLANSETIPEKFALHQNYPNPFNPYTTIQFDLPENSFVKLFIYNAIGQLVRTLIDNEFQAGSYSITWHCVDDHGVKLSTGIYIYQIQAGDYQATQKMIITQ